MLRPPADGKIRAVVCPAFDSAAAATEAAERQRSACATGKSPRNKDKPYTTWYQDVDVKVTGQVVRAEATVTGLNVVSGGFVTKDLLGVWA